MRIQLNSVLFAKTLVRKDVASSSSSSNPSTPAQAETPTTPTTPTSLPNPVVEKKEEEDDFSSKAQIMTLMTTDVDRVSDFSWHLFSLVGVYIPMWFSFFRILINHMLDSPIEILIGSYFLYTLLGISCFIGLAVTCLFLPMNHWAGKVVVKAQDSLMKARDERVSLMNEILGAIRMLKVCVFLYRSYYLLFFKIISWLLVHGMGTQL